MGTDPAGYSSKYIEPLLDKFDGKILLRPDGSRIKTSEGKRAVRECVRELRKLKPVQPLIPSKGMSYGANDHVKDQSKTGATGHEGSDGSSSAIRVNRYGKWDKIIGENIDYGNGNATNIVISLLVDDGVPSRGHRKNIMNSDYAVTGVAVGTHKVYKKMCVITYAGLYIEDN